MDRPKMEGEISSGRTGRPKAPAGINKICRACSRRCKQSARVNMVVCPRFHADASLQGVEAAAARALTAGRKTTARGQVRAPRN